MRLTSCKPAPTPSVAGSAKHKLDDDVDLDMQGCELPRGVVRSLCQLTAVTCISKRTLKRDEATDQSLMDTAETMSPVLGGNLVGEMCARET